MNQKICAFVTGVLAVSMVVLPLPIAYGVDVGEDPADYSDVLYRSLPDGQDYPSSVVDYSDAAAAIQAGVSPVEAIEPSLTPVRAHAAMMADVWQVLFNEQYDAEGSDLLFGSWVDGSHGQLQGESSSGLAVEAEVLLSIACPPEELWEDITPEQIDLIESAEVCFGSALVEVSTFLGSVKLQCAFVDVTDVYGVRSVNLLPVHVVDTSTWSSMESLINNVGYQLFDDVWLEAPYAANPLSIFRGEIKRAARRWVRSVSKGVVAAAVVAAGTVLLGAAAPVVAVVAAVAIIKVVVDANDQFELDSNRQWRICEQI